MCGVGGRKWQKRAPYSETLACLAVTARACSHRRYVHVRDVSVDGARDTLPCSALGPAVPSRRTWEGGGVEGEAGDPQVLSARRVPGVDVLCLQCGFSWAFPRAPSRLSACCTGAAWTLLG